MFWKIQVPAAAPTIFVGLRLGLIYGLVNVIGIEFLIVYGGLGRIVSSMYDNYEFPGMYAAIIFIVIIAFLLFWVLQRGEKASGRSEHGRAASSGHHLGPAGDPCDPAGCVGNARTKRSRLSGRGPAAHGNRPRRDRHPIRPDILLRRRRYHRRDRLGYAVSVIAGIAVGLLFGLKPFVRTTYLPYVNALATTPKIIFLPVVMLAFGVGPASKVALGAFAGFFPVVLATTAGVLQVNPTLLKVARSYKLSTWQTITKVHLPAMRVPIVTGMRLGLGVAVIAVLLGEIKFSNAGLGFLAIGFYNHFDIASLYATLLIIFVLAALVNSAMSWLERALQR